MTSSNANTGESGYGALAWVYDRLNAEIDYGAWADFVEECLRRYAAERPSIVLDLACGTGSASVAVALWLQGQLPGGHLTVENQGGILEVTVEGEKGQVNALYLEGPAEILNIYQIE